MKYLFILSLLCNVVFTLVIFQQRDVLKSKNSQLLTLKTKRHTPAPIFSKSENKAVMAEQLIKTSLSAIEKEGTKLSTEGLEDRDLDQIAEEIMSSREEYLAEIDVSDEVIEAKNDLMIKFGKKVEKLYAQNPMGINMELKDRRKIIELEEKMYKEIEAVFGEEKWRKYKLFVDDYNKKALEAAKDNGTPNMLMGY